MYVSRARYIKKYFSTIHVIFQNNNSEGKKIVWLQDILENGVRFFFQKLCRNFV